MRETVAIVGLSLGVFLASACGGTDDDSPGTAGSSGSAGSAGTGGTGTGGTGGTGGAQANQDGWWCSCDGISSYGLPASYSLEQAQAECQDTCGGPSSAPIVTPKLNVVGSAECDAFCAKADALGCPGDSCASKADFWCQVGARSCVEAELAELDCQAKNGQFSCDGDSWRRSSNCGVFDELCQ